MSAPSYTFDVTQFRISFPEFADETKYPDALLQADFDNASCFIANLNYGFLNGNCRYYALTLMTAHLQKVMDIGMSGRTPGIITEAMVDKVQVELMSPPVLNQWQWWLSTTSYGQILLALLKAAAAGGMYITSGPPERSAFRKAYGIF